ncbi:MAG TPA: hypothetical protein VMW95_06635 [Desulfobacterales bacterium]|nr:hypothetical protein [Desulfobacterales bacterium]
MSSNKRPWYKWYPKDFNQDEKVRCLPPLAEVVYRRALDLMWQSNDIRIPNAMRLLYESLGKGITEDDFAIAWERIQYPDFELFKVSKDEKWLYSTRLRKENDEIVEMSNARSAAGIQGAKARWSEGKNRDKKRLKQTHSKRIANAKQTDSNTDTDTDTDKKKIYKRKMPDDFILTKKLKDYALNKNIQEQKIENMFEHFKNHHLSKGSEFKDWNRAWYTWVLSPYNSKNKGASDDRYNF